MEIEIEGELSEYMDEVIPKSKIPPPPPPRPRKIRPSKQFETIKEESKGMTNAYRFWLTMWLGILFYANLYAYNNWQYLADVESIEFMIILSVFSFDLLSLALWIVHYEPIEKFNKWLNSKEI